MRTSLKNTLKQHTAKRLSETLVPSTKCYGVTSHKAVILMFTSVRIRYGGGMEALSRVEWTSGNIGDYCGHHYTTTTTEVMVVLVMFIFQYKVAAAPTDM